MSYSADEALPIHRLYTKCKHYLAHTISSIPINGFENSAASGPISLSQDTYQRLKNQLFRLRLFGGGFGTNGSELDKLATVQDSVEVSLEENLIRIVESTRCIQRIIKGAEWLPSAPCGYHSDHIGLMSAMRHARAEMLDDEDDENGTYTDTRLLLLEVEELEDLNDCLFALVSVLQRAKGLQKRLQERSLQNSPVVQVQNPSKRSISTAESRSRRQIYGNESQNSRRSSERLEEAMNMEHDRENSSIESAWSTFWGENYDCL